VGLTGQGVLFYDVQLATEADLVHSDTIVIPLALLVLAYVIRSIRLMLIPIISVILSILGSFSFMYALASLTDMEVASFAPSIMMSLVIAMSIDYSLFLLSRYQEELKGGAGAIDAVTDTLQHAGKIILVSGLTLSVTFLGLALFPISFLASIGMAAAVAIVFTIAVNLTLNPALLLIFSGFFSNVSDEWCCAPYCCNKTKEEAADNGMAAYSIYDESPPKTPGGRNIQRIPAKHDKKSIWFKIGQWSTNPRCGGFIVLLVFGGAIPIALQLVHMNVSIDSLQIFPRGSYSLQTWNELTSQFHTTRQRHDGCLLQCIE
jgi:uncharacterized membrane protein YdfJ with MMPL/SSD domain